MTANLVHETFFTQKRLQCLHLKAVQWPNDSGIGVALNSDQQKSALRTILQQVSLFIIVKFYDFHTANSGHFWHSSSKKILFWTKFIQNDHCS